MTIASRVLLVEASQPTTAGYRGHLESSPHRVTAVASIGAARQALAESPVDIVLLDAQLPDGRLGFELNEKTHRLLRRFRTKLLSAAYNAQDDIAEVLVAPPIPWTVRVPLTRAQHLERQAEEPPPPEPPVEESHQPDHQTGSSRSGELH